MDGSGASPPRGRRIALIASAAAVVVIGAVVGGIVLFSGGANQIPQVGDIQATASGSSVTFEWDDPGIAPDDSYLVRVDGSADGTQTSRSLTVDRAAAGERVCVTVTVVRDGRNGTPSDSICWSE